MHFASDNTGPAHPKVMEALVRANQGYAMPYGADALMDVGVDGSNLAFNLTWHDWLNLRSLCDISEVITKAGIARENSRGAHFREDYPEPGAMEDSDFTVARRDGEGVTVTRDPVQFTIVRPGETVLPEDAPETLVAVP